MTTTNRLQQILFFLWVLVLLAFPFTSPPLPGTYALHVKPLSFLPNIFLVLLLILSSSAKIRIAKYQIYLLLFVLYIFCFGLLFSQSSSFILFKGLTPTSAFIKSVVSIFIGLTFYLSFIKMVQDAKIYKKTLLILSIGVSISSLFGIIQFLFQNYIPGLLPYYSRFISLFVDTTIEWQNRVHGFALEPSWLTSQICLVILPLGISSLFSGSSTWFLQILRTRFSLDYIFLLVGVVAIALSGSRKGLLILGISLLVAFLTLLQKLQAKKIIFVIIFVLILGSIVVPLATNISYIDKTLHAFKRAENLTEFVGMASVGERSVGMVSGFYTFTDYPIFGVGLGQNIFYSTNYLPEWFYETQSVDNWLDPNSRFLPNARNIFIRVLAETGLVGFVLFILFLYSTYTNCRPQNEKELLFRRILIVNLIFNYAVRETFALPDEWFALGLLTFSSYINISKSVNDEN